MLSFLTWYCHSHSNLHPLCQDHQPSTGQYLAVSWRKAVQMVAAEADQKSGVWPGMSWNTEEGKEPMMWPFVTPTAHGWPPFRVSLAADHTTPCPDEKAVLNFGHWPKPRREKENVRAITLKSPFLIVSKIAMISFTWEFMCSRWHTSDCALVAWDIF